MYATPQWLKARLQAGAIPLQSFYVAQVSVYACRMHIANLILIISHGENLSAEIRIYDFCIVPYNMPTYFQFFYRPLVPDGT